MNKPKIEKGAAKPVELSELLHPRDEAGLEAGARRGQPGADATGAMLAPPPAMPLALLRALAREPLLHFVLLGAGLFALDGVARPSPAPVAPIVVDAGLRTELAEGFRRARGRAPAQPELDALVARWVDDEVLYREGLARGLDRDDAQVRQRVAAKMAFVLHAQVVPPTPREADLRAWFNQHAERYARGALTDFSQVFVAGDDDAARARAAELLALLRTGADPSGLGDRFSGGRRYRLRRLEDLAETFGDEFARGVSAQPVGAWALHRSRFGLHLVRVDQRTPARAADFEAARLDIQRDWEEDARTRAQATALAALRRRWPVAVR